MLHWKWLILAIPTVEVNMDHVQSRASLHRLIQYFFCLAVQGELHARACAQFRGNISPRVTLLSAALLSGRNCANGYHKSRLHLHFRVCLISCKNIQSEIMEVIVAKSKCLEVHDMLRTGAVLYTEVWTNVHILYVASWYCIIQCSSYTVISVQTL